MLPHFVLITFLLLLQTVNGQVKPDSGEVYDYVICFLILLWVLCLSLLVYGLFEELYFHMSFSRHNSYAYTVTVLAADPTPSYDYDNTSLRIDLADSKDNLIASLLMKPLKFVDENDRIEAEQAKKKSITSLKQLDQRLSRRVPLLGIFKIVSHNPLRKIAGILIAHNCPEVASMILVRGIEITNVSSLECHTYPVNAYVSHLREPYDIPIESLKGQDKKGRWNTEFGDERENLPRNLQEQRRRQLSIMEQIALLLFCTNIILIGCFFALSSITIGRTEENEPKFKDQGGMWGPALLYGSIVGGIMAVVYIVVAIIYKLSKGFFAGKEVNTFLIRFIFVCIMVLLSVVALIIFVTQSANEFNQVSYGIWIRMTVIATVVLFVAGILLLILLSHCIRLGRESNRVPLNAVQIPAPTDKPKLFKMMTLDAEPIHILNFPHLSLFGSLWLRAVLKQHDGLDRVILCDVQEVLLQPNDSVLANISKEAAKIFKSHKEKDLEQGTAWAIQLMEQRGLVRSVSQYGRMKRPAVPKTKSTASTGREVIHGGLTNVPMKAKK